MAFLSATAQNLPAPGASTVNVSFAPLSNVGVASATDPIPRFGDTSTPRAAFTINLCTCDLLFPFMTNTSGFDTGIAIANTSLDPFGTGPQQGTVKLYYFGSTAGGGVAPPPFVTQTVPAGQELIFNLSGGGNFGVPAVPGFEGYIISVANFQYCHGFAFISDVGAQKLAEGYLAIQLDFPVQSCGCAVRIQPDRRPWRERRSLTETVVALTKRGGFGLPFFFCLHNLTFGTLWYSCKVSSPASQLHPTERFLYKNV